MTHLRLVRLDGMPLKRSDCASVPRPCPYKECRFNMDADPLLSCALDVADRGEAHLSVIASSLGISKPAVHNMINRILRKLVKGRRVTDLHPFWEDAV